MIASTSLPLPPLPGSGDLVRLVPELVVGVGFIVLMILELLIPARRRGLLAAVTVAVLLAAFAAVMVGWFDTGHQGLAYAQSIAYDRFAFFLDAIVISTAVLATVLSPGYLHRRGLHYGEYYALLLGAVLGMMLLVAATSLMVVFLGIELLSISLYVMSAFARDQERSQEAGLKYLLLGGFASGFLLYGMALIYGETGHTQLPRIQAALQAGSHTTDPLLLTGIALLLVGLAFKVSAAPFHTWTPDVYQGAPTAVTTFMSVATKVAAFGALIRLFTATFYSVADRWQGVVAFVAIVSMVLGNVAALTQSSVKRMLAYSGIAQAGYVLIGVVVVDPLGTVGALYYLAAYAAMNLGAFAVVTVMTSRGKDLDDYDDLRGLAYRRPYVAAAMGLFLLSLAGFPPTAGFIAKFLVFSAAIKTGQTYLALWGIATSAISVYYYLRVALLMYQRPRPGEEPYPWARASVAGGGVLAVATAGTVFLGIFVAFLYNAASLAQAGAIPPFPRVGG